MPKSINKTRCPKCNKYRHKCGLGHCGDLFPGGEAVEACFECFETTSRLDMIAWGRDRAAFIFTQKKE